jgi:hypothetical protein
VSLMGYDPYGSVSKPGKRDDMASAWEDDEKEERLPHWATDWPADVEKPCEPGTQCAEGVGNPLGVIGKWVMQATSAQGNAKRDWELRHNCVGLPVSYDTACATAHLFALLLPRGSIILAHFSELVGKFKCRCQCAVP